jgi:hypothetical protein
MEEALTLVNKLGGVSFATLLMVILWGSWKGIWRWGKDFDALEIRLRTERAVILDDRDWWRNIAVRATGLAETQGQLLKVTSHVDEINRELLDDRERKP